MNRRSRAGRFVSRLGIVVLVLLVAGCTSTTATPSPNASVTASPIASPSTAAAAPTLTPAPSPSPSPSPVASPLAAGFTTPAPGSATSAWTAIAWKPIAADDPLGTVTGMVAAPSGGYVAWANPVAVGSTASASPVWSSADGTTWSALPADTFGPAGTVVAIGPAGGKLVALTLTGGANTCGDNTDLFCWTPEGPLQAWTSTDGVAWTPAAAPAVTLAEDCSGCGVEPPIVAFAEPGALVAAPTTPKGVPGTLQIVNSPDGSSWTAAPAGALPAAFHLNGIAGHGDGFLAVGDNGKDPARAEVATSSDGMTWTVRHLAGQGTSGGQAFVGSDGILVGGSTQETPGTELWWTSPDAVTWQSVDGYPPLGVWNGEGEGSGLISDGSVAADGARLFALRTEGGVKSWTSTDGASWTALPSTGLKAQPKGSWPTTDVVMLPAGVIATEDGGARWFGTPAQGG